MRDFIELERLEEQIEGLTGQWTGILTMLNRKERTDGGRGSQLDELLELLGITDPYPQNEFVSFKTGMIVVLGASEVDEIHLTGIAKDFGLPKKRLEFCLHYDDLKSYDFNKLQWKPEKYSLVLVGQMPHKTEGTDRFSSAIARMEQEEGFPPVLRCGTSGLKISKTSFREALAKAFSDKIIKL